MNFFFLLNVYINYLITHFIIIIIIIYKIQILCFWMMMHLYMTQIIKIGKIKQKELIIIEKINIKINYNDKEKKNINFFLKNLIIIIVIFFVM